MLRERGGPGMGIEKGDGDDVIEIQKINTVLARELKG